MAAIVPFINVAMTFWCTQLFGYLRSDDSEVCYQGNTGQDSGGSCTFDKGHCCDWESTGWVVNENREAFADMQWRYQGATAVLTSPWMCEDNVTTICVQFHFMFNDNDGGRLTLKLCHDTKTCVDLWWANSGDKKEWSWYQGSNTVTLTQGNRFQIQFEGNKIEDSAFRETNFYLDNIVYKNVSCSKKPTLILSSSTINSLTSKDPTTENYPELSTAQTANTHQQNDDTNTANEEESSMLTMIAVLIAVLLLTAAVVVVALYVRRQRADGDAGTKKSSITSDETRSIFMVTNDLYSVSGGYQHTEEGFPLQDLDTPQNHDVCYAKVHKTKRGHVVTPRPDLEVLMQHGCDNPVKREMYENVTLDNGNILPQPTLGISSQSCSDEPQESDDYYSYCH